MATNEAIKEILEHFKQQRQRKVEAMLAELGALDTTIGQLQMQLGDVPDKPPDLASLGFPLLQEAMKPRASQPSGGLYTPRPDEFFGKSQGDAARLFLEKIGHAISLDDLVNGLRSGGCKVGGVDPKKTLYISLVRNVREFVPTGNGFIGLRKFYPDMPKLGRPKSDDKRKKSSATQHRKKSTRPKGDRQDALRAANHPQTASAHQPGEVKTLIHEILSDRVARTPEDVLRAVENRLGHPVQKIAVYGALRKKDFEQVGDKYRLRPSDGSIQVLQ